jgi:hypothetical protein
MGFYIHTCPKMRYKSEYRPSELLCPESNVSDAGRRRGRRLGAAALLLLLLRSGGLFSGFMLTV